MTTAQTAPGPERLREVGLRVTAPRLAVLEAVRDHPHTDTDTITRVVRDSLGKVSVQAVYDVLGALTEAGLLRRIKPAGLVARYELHVGDNHHHLVCRGCGAIVDVECAKGERPCLHPTDDHGFVVDEAEVIYWGHCAACRHEFAQGHHGPGQDQHSQIPATEGESR
ncbi:Fur family transcriptional regulator [Propionibacteriaceae bacterium Y2011]|uniref:Fur family transcriptional regulator n=1 Tax=Microlunatus sp. Y2014 TaxID=3418488 RepID=UPI003B46E7D1